MGLDFAIMQAMPYDIFLGVIGLIGLKAIMISSLTVAFGVTASQAVRTGLLLSAGGEFAFVIIGGAMAGGVLDRMSRNICSSLLVFRWRSHLCS